MGALDECLDQSCCPGLKCVLDSAGQSSRCVEKANAEEAEAPKQCSPEFFDCNKNKPNCCSGLTCAPGGFFTSHTGCAKALDECLDQSCCPGLKCVLDSAGQSSRCVEKANAEKMANSSHVFV